MNQTLIALSLLSLGTSIPAFAIIGGTDVSPRSEIGKSVVHFMVNPKRIFAKSCSGILIGKTRALTLGDCYGDEGRTTDAKESYVIFTSTFWPLPDHTQVRGSQVERVLVHQTEGYPKANFALVDLGEDSTEIPELKEMGKKHAKLLSYERLKKLDLRKHPITVSDYSLRNERAPSRHILVWTNLSGKPNGGASDESNLNSIQIEVDAMDFISGKMVGFTTEKPLHQERFLTDLTSMASIELEGETYFIGIRQDATHFGAIYKEMFPE